MKLRTKIVILLVLGMMIISGTSAFINGTRVQPIWDLSGLFPSGDGSSVWNYYPEHSTDTLPYGLNVSDGTGGTVNITFRLPLKINSPYVTVKLAIEEGDMSPGDDVHVVSSLWNVTYNGSTYVRDTIQSVEINDDIAIYTSGQDYISLAYTGVTYDPNKTTKETIMICAEITGLSGNFEGYINFIGQGADDDYDDEIVTIVNGTQYNADFYFIVEAYGDVHSLAPPEEPEVIIVEVPMFNWNLVWAAVGDFFLDWGVWIVGTVAAVITAVAGIISRVSPRSKAQADRISTDVRLASQQVSDRLESLRNRLRQVKS